jgi:repressor LexA
MPAGLVSNAPLADEMVEIPLVGRVAAGQPMLAVENVEDTVKVDRFFLGNTPTKEVFALRVKGESMIEDGIFDGDFIFVRKSLTAEKGDIVVALIDDEATVKRYFPEGDVIRFQPANAAMQPIMVRRRDFKSVNLIGIVVGVYRKIR